MIVLNNDIFVWDDILSCAYVDCVFFSASMSDDFIIISNNIPWSVSGDFVVVYDSYDS